MRKIPSLFKRDYEGTRLVYDDIVPGSEWVLTGEGIATIKWDGTACMVRAGILYRRHDRKLNKKTQGHKPAPDGWEPCEEEPNEHTGHWPGWVPIGDGPEDKWHRQAWKAVAGDLLDGTYELVGPKVQGNPYGLDNHELWRHGSWEARLAARDFEGLRSWFADRRPDVEGIVWHHPDGRMVKIKRKDFGLAWPPEGVEA